MEAHRLAQFDRKRDPLEVLDPRVELGRLKAIPKTRLVDKDVLGPMRQADLARALGVAKSTVTKWAKGQAPMSNRQVISASHVLDVSPFWMLGIVGDLSFDWQTPAMPPSQFEQAKRLRHELDTIVKTHNMADALLEEYPADYRDPNQLLADVISYCEHQRSKDAGDITLMCMLLSCGLHVEQTSA